VLVESQDCSTKLGVHLETCTTNPRRGAPGASINSPLAGCVTWKSIVGTQRGRDALSNLAIARVIGGALIVVGETMARAPRSSRSGRMPMREILDLVDGSTAQPAVDRALHWKRPSSWSEATNTPVMMELRIRACHVTASSSPRDNKATRHFRISGSPIRPCTTTTASPIRRRTYAHAEGQGRGPARPAAERFIVEHASNELIPGERSDLGIIMQGRPSPTGLRVSTGWRSRAGSRSGPERQRTRWCGQSPISARASARC